MNGRGLFKLIKYPLNLIVCILRLIPNFLLVLVYDFLTMVPTKIGVLLRYVVVKSMSRNIGDNVYIGRYVILKNIKKLHIGNNVSIHEFCYIDAVGSITIGDNVSIAHNSSIISFEHTWSDTSVPIKYNKIITKPIIIEDDVWIGCGVRILSGSYVSKRSILAAGTVFKLSGEKNSIYVGMPSKKKKEI
ncbi:acyltransferase [Escherichia coli]|uniref:Acyltransferase n=3 Tax=Escherichia coli TaxID=562 RepID=B5L3N2_ECOLX|nr:acyltransferase [Escherichia coli]ACA24902.1 WfgM [Escherichia coli]EER3793371.1 acyltransferase [Escherichia coli]EES1383302.1 acyltransferase [Escherichia coli]EET4309495.1 acyltransferase [Escherichia coli]EET5745872.1 acyltransferase [Escherichia coli]